MFPSVHMLDSGVDWNHPANGVYSLSVGNGQEAGDASSAHLGVQFFVTDRLTGRKVVVDPDLVNARTPDEFLALKIKNNFSAASTTPEPKGGSRLGAPVISNDLA